MSDRGIIGSAESPTDLLDAFNRHGVDAVVSFFADDSISYAVAGIEVYGARIEDSDAQAFDKQRPLLDG